jgi:hypothetical protein
MGSQLVVLDSGQRYDGSIGIWYGKAPGLDRAATRSATACSPARPATAA